MAKPVFRCARVAFSMAVLLVVGGSGARAALLDSNVIFATDPFSGGTIEITSSVFDNFGGDFSKYEFRYDVLNLSYDPSPGTSNGLSGYQVIFSGAVSGVADQYAPPGWFFNCCGTAPPFGAEADIDNSTGFGIPIGGGGSFGYSVPSGAAWTDAVTGSWAHSWEFDIQVNVFDQVDSTTGRSILTPLPEPGLLLLLAAVAAAGLLRPGLRP